MKVAVLGLWHLGCVTAAGLASVGHTVIGYDCDEQVIANLKQGQPPLFEPGLEELLHSFKDRLSYTSSLQAISEAQVIWVTIDTPVDADDKADVAFVMDEIEASFAYLADNAIVIISSQLPVGSTRRLQQIFSQRYPAKSVSFVCSPENLRLGKALQVFLTPDRIVMGINSEQDKPRIIQLLKSITSNIVWMSVESAEMTKHALNAFLATSVVFINEIATICEQVGADAKEVEAGLKSDIRIGQRAYLRPGGAFAGGTLARDLAYLTEIAGQHHVPVELFPAVLESNKVHMEWSRRKIVEVMGNLKDKTIAMLGLTYKPGTNTLRRSTAVEICHSLNAQKARVLAYDPAINTLPDDLQAIIHLQSSLKTVIQGADAIIVSTECPEFHALSANEVFDLTNQPIVLDASGFLSKTLGQDDRVHYFSVGKRV